MKKAYETAAMFFRWLAVCVAVFIVALPALISVDAA